MTSDNQQANRTSILVAVLGTASAVFVALSSILGTLLVQERQDNEAAKARVSQQVTDSCRKFVPLANDFQRRELEMPRGTGGIYETQFTALKKSQVAVQDAADTLGLVPMSNLYDAYRGYGFSAQAVVLSHLSLQVASDPAGHPSPYERSEAIGKAQLGISKAGNLLVDSRKILDSACRAGLKIDSELFG